MAIDWQSLQQLRDRYFSQAGEIRDYWQNQKIVEDYHHTLGQRILWKWENVLRRVKDDSIFEKLASPRSLVVKDWGCGSGIASLAFLEAFPGRAKEIVLSDRSKVATSFAAQQLRSLDPELSISQQHDDPFEQKAVDVLLISHVLTEMNSAQIDQLIQLARFAEIVIWVEAGTYQVSRKLIDVRENMVKDYDVVAPCTHNKPCGMLQASNEDHWCHFFGDVPTEVHHSAFWREFSKKLSIDLRSLPLAYLVLKRAGTSKSDHLDKRQLMIGRPRVYKGYCKFIACDSRGVGECELQKKHDKRQFKSLSKGGFGIFAESNSESS